MNTFDEIKKIEKESEQIIEMAHRDAEGMLVSGRREVEEYLSQHESELEKFRENSLKNIQKKADRAAEKILAKEAQKRVDMKNLAQSMTVKAEELVLRRFGEKIDST